MSGVEIMWKFVEYLLVGMGVSIYWILKRHKELAVVCYVLFKFIDKPKMDTALKVKLIHKMVTVLDSEGVRCQRYASQFIKKHYEQTDTKVQEAPDE